MGCVAAATHSASWERAGYRSTQTITLPDVDHAFEEWATQAGLLQMLRAYFAVAESTAARLVRAHWSGSRPELALLWPRIPFIRMGEPVLNLSVDRAAIKVAIEGGLLVTSSIQAYLVLELDRELPNLIARVDLVGYRPRFGQIALVRWAYELTQARVHRHVGVRFLAQFGATCLHARVDVTGSSSAG